MKNVFLFAAVAVILAACGEHDPQVIETRDPLDVTGTYEVDYKIWVDGTPVSAEMLSGRVEVRGESIRELFMDFHPDSDLIKFSPGGNTLSLAPIRPVGYAGAYTFDDYRSTVSLECAGNSGTVGPLTMIGTIEAKSSAELVADGFAYMSGGSCLYIHPLPQGPDVHHHLTMTIDFWVPDPTLPSGTEIVPEEGIGVHKYRIEIASR